MSEFINVIVKGIGSVYRPELAIFAIGTITISLILCLLDWISTKLFHTPSLLKVGYGGLRTFQSLMFWGLGAGVAAYVGGLAELFNVQSMNTKIIVGLGWPTVLPRLIEMTEKEDEPEQPEQIDEEEEQ